MQSRPTYRKKTMNLVKKNPESFQGKVKECIYFLPINKYDTLLNVVYIIITICI